MRLMYSTAKRACLPAKSSSLSRLRILKEDLPCLGICNRLQSAIRFQVCCEKTALRIRDFPKCSIREIISEVAIPLNVR